MVIEYETIKAQPYRCDEADYVIQLGPVYSTWTVYRYRHSYISHEDITIIPINWQVTRVTIQKDH